MTLQDYLNETEFDKGDRIGLRDHAGNILVNSSTKSRIPKKYLNLIVRKSFIHETYWEGKKCPSLHELWLETIDHELIEHREELANAFAKFLHSFECVDPEQVAILCKVLLTESSQGFEDNYMIGDHLGLCRQLPDFAPDEKLVR